MKTWKNINKQFLRLFVPTAVIFWLVVMYFYSSEVEKERANHEANEVLHLNLGKQVIEKDMEAAVADLRVLSQHSEFDNVNALPNSEALGYLSREFLAFVKSKRHYDQIRFLDEDGKEAIRINFNSGYPYIVPEDQLQEKIRRYYFANTIRLKEREVFISPLDLNIEHGEVEMPVKLVIRLATPVLYGQGKKRGVLVLNYLGSNLMRDFKEATAGIADHAMILNAGGLLMYDPRTKLEWGSQLGHGLMFKKQFPRAWERIAKANSGYFYNSKGLFTFDTIYPLQGMWKSSTEAAVSGELSSSEAKGKENYWKVVAHVPDVDIDSATFAIAMRLLLVSMPLFVLVTAGCWWQAKTQVRRMEADEVLTKRASQQASVAELGRRALSGVGLAALMDTIVEYVAEVLGVDYCQVLELLANDDALVLRAGVGWKEGLVGQVTVGAGIDSQAGYTLVCTEPVIVEDLRQETRFTGSQLLQDHGVVSGMSVIIQCVGRSFGVLGVHTSKWRTFTRDDVNYLQAVANIMSEVVERESAQAKTHLQTSALAAAADSIVITDRDGDIQWVNPAYTTLTGYKLDEVLGKNPRILKSGKHDQSFYKQLWDTILSGKTWHGELYNKRKDGSLYLEDESITSVLDQSGEISHFIAIKRDITERQQLQKQLQQAQKMEAIGQLTGGIAHDFNNMLSGILGYTELAREELAQYGNKQIEGYLSQVDKSGTRARDLVAQMLAFSRGGEGEHCPHILTALIKESLKMLGSTLPSSIEVELQLDDDLVVMTDPVQLHQLIMNLCINARDAMEGKGSITIGSQRVTCPAGEYSAVTECRSCHERIEGDYIQLSVHDTGSGIQPGQLDRIFDPFYTTKDVGKGTGMGLSMVHGIMHDHGGHIVVETSKGDGTTFALLFPVIEVQEDVVSRQDSVTQTSSDQVLEANILIVDDEVSVGHFIGELAKGHGCQVTVETDSRLALSIFRADPEAFDLVITDQTMPGMSGVELAQSLVAIRPELPVILCTGYSEGMDEARARSMGVSAYVNKPIETDGFLGLVKELLQARAIKPENVHAT